MHSILSDSYVYVIDQAPGQCIEYGIARVRSQKTH